MPEPCPCMQPCTGPVAGAGLPVLTCSAGVLTLIDLMRHVQLALDCDRLACRWCHYISLGAAV